MPGQLCLPVNVSALEDVDVVRVQAFKPRSCPGSFWGCKS